MPKSTLWRTGDGWMVVCDERRRRYDEAVERFRVKPGDLTAHMVDRYIDNEAFLILEAWTRYDYWICAERFARHFQNVPMRFWSDKRMRGALISWRKRWLHSPKQADMP